ncbi:ABC transporter ATP-binding protein [Pseudoroseicyclus aestuarii]|uniref:Peptide/nickel transport system ATP-binding protein n=1 Tax=Pseudoroseicyclus aestuarii TaxID=1795041 RepID=A0A318SP07_9RHOB|nr:ATP-binding cassette domain-containing protein [Pseudoroseicyclus aestuarii]PYE82426.1 peptide/nickel transport system ATP-binding protein [Pseudoroseicyclus aestuarii]
MTEGPLLQARGLGKTFVVGDHRVQALKDVDLEVASGECHAVVGESGSGKSTLANIVLGIYPASAGEMLFDGAPLGQTRPRAMRRRIQLVQQNPLSSLNIRRRIGASIRLPLDVHGIGARSERPARVEALLEEVGLEPEMARRTPASLSGGQRQRVAIARALAAEPDLIVLDEPTSALDVLVQARVLALLDRLRRERGLTYIFITHDLAVVRALADRISVFVGGEKVETGTTEAIFTAPQAAFTRQLIGAVPVASEEEARMRDVIRETGHTPG